MKSRFFRFWLLACIPLFSVACSGSDKLSGNEFLIEGKISGVEDGAVIMLFRYDGDFGMNIATDTLKNGRFVFKLETISDPEKMGIICFSDGYPSSRSLDFWVAPGKKIKISGKDRLLPAWEVKSSTPYQKEANRYANINRDINREMTELSIDIIDMRTKVRNVSSEETFAYRKIIDSLEMIHNALKIKEIFANIGIMEKMDVSPIWLDKMNGIAMTLKYSNVGSEFAGDIRKKAEELYGKMSEEDKSTSIGYKITANLFPPPTVGIGDGMIDGDFFDINGNTKHLSDYSGKYMLLDFWSRGCGPCIMALPEMKEVSEIYHDKLTIVSISLDSDAVWKEAMSTHNMPWVNIRDPKGWGGLAANYDVRGIPNYVMISPEGNIIDKWMGFGNGLIKGKVSENVE